MLTGQNGILKRAGESQEKTEIGQEKEIVALAYNSAVTKKASKLDFSAVTSAELNEELVGSDATATGNNPITVTFENGHKYTIDNNGNITKKELGVISEDLAKLREYFSKNVIAVDRKPYKNYNYKENPEKFIYFIKDDKSQPYSSTSIRDCYLKGDYVGIKNITFPEVAEMVIKFYKNNFKGY